VVLRVHLEQMVLREQTVALVPLALQGLRVQLEQKVRQGLQVTLLALLSERVKEITLALVDMHIP